MALRRALLPTILIVLALVPASMVLAAQPPTLLLTDARMKRLKRDRDRQTQRWTDFEARVKNVPESPERGFELALYYRITADPAIAAEAQVWAKSHPCERRQVALIRNLLDSNEVAATPASPCPPSQEGPLARMRDSVFESAGKGELTFDSIQFLRLIDATSLNNAREIYAATEILLALGRELSDAARRQDPQFFNSLPVQFLLSLKPSQVDHPDWMTHVAALGLIALDPNSDSAQFLQGWAIEDRQMIAEGPGVAYELLWADPYLPGVGYQNLDPWWYDETRARLLARTGWGTDACSVRISPAGVLADQCPADWQSKTMQFGHLSLIPMNEQCLQVPARPSNTAAILWKLGSSSRVKANEAGKSVTFQADRTGLWRVPSNISGKICQR